MFKVEEVELTSLWIRNPDNLRWNYRPANVCSSSSLPTKSTSAPQEAFFIDQLDTHSLNQEFVQYLAQRGLHVLGNTNNRKSELSLPLSSSFNTDIEILLGDDVNMSPSLQAIMDGENPSEM